MSGKVIPLIRDGVDLSKRPAPSGAKVEGILLVTRRFESGWCFGTIGEYKFAGVVPDGFKNGDIVEAQGKWEEHQRFGKQFKARGMTLGVPKTVEAVEKWLATLPNIGAQRASAIVSKFGVDALRIVEEEPNRLATINGLTSERVEEIVAEWAKRKHRVRAEQFLVGFGLNFDVVNRIINKVGPDLCIQKVRDDPWSIRDVKGMRFPLCDEIGAKLGIPKNHPNRQRAAVIETLSLAYHRAGHCMLTRQLGRMDREGPLDLLARINSAKFFPDAHVTMSVLLDLAAADQIVIEPNTIYLPDVWKWEDRVAKTILSLIDKPFDPIVVDEANLACLNAGQREAIRLAAAGHRFLILTGGPGTGKTFTIKFLLRELFAGLTVELAAPTGRAAKRMEELIGAKSSTIHRLLGFDGESGTFTRPSIDCEVLILDEVSMLDLSLAYEVLSRVSAQTRVVFVGDPDQLPSVQAGNVLRDVLKSRAVPIARLEQIMRQESDSPIIYAAHHARLGRDDTLRFANGESGDPTTQRFRFVHASRVEDVFARLDEVVDDFLGSGINILRDVQVLGAQRQKSPLATPILNARLQAKLNPTGPELERGETIFRLGDRVIQTKNCYSPDVVRNADGRVVDDPSRPRKQRMRRPVWEPDEDLQEDEENKIAVGPDPVFNGDTGEIVEVEPAGIVVQFSDQRWVRIKGESLWDVELAYAITCHKSQGSEYPHVVLIVHPGYVNLSRRLFYTGLTRAQSSCTIIGTEASVIHAVSTDASELRASGLSWRLQGHDTV